MAQNFKGLFDLFSSKQRWTKGRLAGYRREENWIVTPVEGVKAMDVRAKPANCWCLLGGIIYLAQQVCPRGDYSRLVYGSTAKAHEALAAHQDAILNFRHSLAACVATVVQKYPKEQTLHLHNAQHMTASDIITNFNDNGFITHEDILEVAKESDKEFKDKHPELYKKLQESAT